MFKRGFPLLLVACVATGTVWAANDPLVGKWKLDTSKSKVTDLMIVAAAGGNKYVLTFNTGDCEPVVADGSDQPASFGTTVSITVIGPDAWKVVRKKDGHTLLTGNWKLSEDGKTLTDHFSSNRPDGSTSSVDYVYKRSAGDSGFPGAWESANDTMGSAFELQIEPYEGDGLSLIIPAEGSTRNMKFDGKDYPSEGQYTAPGSAASGHRVNERKVELTDKINGRVVDTQEIELSPDLKTLTVTMHPSGQSKPNILVFGRE